MNQSFISNAEARHVITKLAKKADSMSWAVAWATENPLIAVALANKNKFDRLIVGTHLYQTDPDVLEELSVIAEARAMPPTNALFHPKTYLFRSGEKMSALVGSHNLTGAAMARNIEASVLIEGLATDEVFVELLSFMKKAQQDAVAIPSFLYGYRAQWKLKKAARDQLERFVPPAKPKTGGKIPPLHELEWDEYMHLVRTIRPKFYARRLQLLSEVASLFSTYPSYAAMPLIDRKAIAGTLGKKASLIRDTDFGLFGSMFGQGDFKNLVIKRPHSLSLALNAIPRTGPVTRKHYENFVGHFKTAFLNAAHKGGIPTATRLLAMKRPDYFVCLDLHNKKTICDLLSVAVSSTTLETYWDRIIEQLFQTPWWTANTPFDAEGQRVWLGRAAMLDSIFYTP